MTTSKQLFPINLHGPFVRSGLQDKTLHDKRVQIKDALNFTIEVRREISAQSKWLNAVNIAGVVSWWALMVTDIIQNCVKVTGVGNMKVVLMLLDKVKQQANKHKFDGARYKTEVEKIELVRKELKKVLPKQGQELADLFADMAEDWLGLAGFMEEADASRSSLEQSIRSSIATVAKMEALLRKIDAQIADDALTDSTETNGSPTRGGMSKAPVVNFSGTGRMP